VLIAVLVFALAAGIVLGMYWAFVVRPERQAESAFRNRMVPVRTIGRRLSLGVQRETERLSSLPTFDHLLRALSWLSGPLQRLIKGSGVPTSVGVIVLASACLGLLGLQAGKAWFGPLWMGLLLGAGLAAVPVGYLRRKRTRRLRRFEELFTEALGLMTRAMRAGHTFTTALGMVAKELPDPIASEFRLLYDQQNFGMPIDEALRNFGERVPLLPAKFFVTAVLTQREAGGNLTEVFDNLARVITDRFMILRQVQLKSASGKLTGWILAAMPPAVGVLFSVSAPGHFNIMFEERLGIQMMIAGVMLQIVGVLVIRKIINVEY
jgi:tight adherence protein B